jgi:hypothetical protein
MPLEWFELQHRINAVQHKINALRSDVDDIQTLAISVLAVMGFFLWLRLVLGGR